jgi:hypothetical protein
MINLNIKKEHRKIILFVCLLVVIYFVGKQVDISRESFPRDGTTNCDLNYLKGLCRPGISIWQDSTSTAVCPSQLEYFFGDEFDYPPTWPEPKVLAYKCPDGDVCCRTAENVFKTMKESVCVLPYYDVDSSLCPAVVHECEKDTDCPTVKMNNTNDCSPLWTEKTSTVNGMCNSQFRCVYSNKDAAGTCKDWQYFVQDYKWYIAAGFVFLLFVLILFVPRRGRQVRRQ